MIYGLYSVFDVVAGAYMAPSMAVNDNVAQRSFAANFGGDNPIFALNPADFRLMKVGEFSPESGNIVACEPVLVCDGVSAKNMIER